MVKVFLTSRLSILFVIASLLSGVLALLVTPREEEPKIVVPVADILVNAPGATAEEVEKLAAKPLESFLWEIDGVEFVYTFSRPGMAVAITLAVTLLGDLIVGSTHEIRPSLVVPRICAAR